MTIERPVVDPLRPLPSAYRCFFWQLLCSAFAPRAADLACLL